MRRGAHLDDGRSVLASELVPAWGDEVTHAGRQG
jgi:hypothetical protein